jgi:hypothetical protein
MVENLYLRELTLSPLHHRYGILDLIHTPPTIDHIRLLPDYRYMVHHALPNTVSYTVLC